MDEFRFRWNTRSSLGIEDTERAQRAIKGAISWQSEAVVDNSNGSELEAERQRKLMPTGVSEEDVRAKLYSHGAEPEDVGAELGPGDWPFMGFRKYIGRRWWFFVIPRCMGPDGYLVWELQ